MSGQVWTQGGNYTPACQCPQPERDLFCYKPPVVSHFVIYCGTCGAQWRSQTAQGTRLESGAQATEQHVRKALRRGAITPEDADVTLQAWLGLNLQGRRVQWKGERTDAGAWQRWRHWEALTLRLLCPNWSAGERGYTLLVLQEDGLEVMRVSLDASNNAQAQQQAEEHMKRWKDERTTHE